jgi:hypothetical protein
VEDFRDVERMSHSERNARRARAFSCVAVPAVLAAAVAVTAAVAAESIEPFPPGKNAALVKQVCTACHSAMLVVDRKFDVAAAKKMYRLFVGNPDSDQGKLVVEYLSTVLGEDGPPEQAK